MPEKRRLWRVVGVLVLIGLMALIGCERGGKRGEKEIPQGRAAPEAVPPVSRGKGDPASDDVAYLTRLALIRGHLLVGMELYRAGATDAAATQMVGPESPPYTGIQAAFAVRGTHGFAKQLQRMTAAVDGDGGASETAVAYEQLRTAIAKAESAVNLAVTVEAAAKLQVAANLLRAAADEYAVGVVKSAVVNPHDYQNAYGYTKVARDIVSSIRPGPDENLRKALMGVKEDLDVADTAWPSLEPKEQIEADSSLLRDTANRIQRAADSLK